MRSHPLAHHRDKRKRRRTAYNRARSSRVWQDYRRTCLAFYGPVCMRCGTRRGSLQVHHLDPIGEGFPLMPTLDRIEVLCPKCHRYRHKSSAARAWDDLLETIYG